MNNTKFPLKKDKALEQDFSVEVTEAKVEAKPSEPTYTRFMVGSYLDAVTNRWMLAYTKFDPVTGLISELKVEPVGGDYEIMRERFQIKAIKLGVFELGEIPDDGKTDNFDY